MGIILFGLLALVSLLAAPAWAQTAPATSFDWRVILAAGINTAGVLGGVQMLKVALPGLRSSTPWLIPILATLGGPVVAVVQTQLSTWLGLGIDLSPLLGVLTGAAATTTHQVYTQATQ